MCRNKQDFIEQRNKDLLSVYNKVLKESRGYINLDTIARKIYDHPAKRFYISSEEASKRVYGILKNGKNRCRDLREEMYKEIARKAIKIKSDNIEKPLREIIEEIVEQPAPKFYLTQESIYVIISNIKNRNRHKRRMV